MAEMIAVVGESGSGKSTSIRNLDPKETFIISTTGKRPGIKGALKKYPTFTKTADGYIGNFCNYFKCRQNSYYFKIYKC